VPNANMIRRVVQRIQNHLDKWNQQTWAGVRDYDNDEDYEAAVARLREALFHFTQGGEDRLLLSDAIVPEGVCGTNFCFAGHAVLEAGDAIVFDLDDLGYADMVRTPEGNYVGLENRARSLLGLTEEQSDRLFDGEAGAENWETYKRLVTAQTGVDLSDI